MRTSVLVAALVLFAAGCAGDGSGIVDEMMGGGGDPMGPVTIDDVWNRTLGVVCTECHVPGGIGPFSMESPEIAEQNLVGVPSFEVLLNRVEPGDPNCSYIYIKIAGVECNGIVRIGDPMPPPPRSITAEQIEEIRQWILDLEPASP